MQCIQCTLLYLSVFVSLIEGEDDDVSGVKQSFVSHQSVMFSSLLSLLLSLTLLRATAGVATRQTQSQSDPPGLGHDLNTVNKKKSNIL